MRKKIVFRIILAAVILSTLFLITREPRNDREWEKEIAYTSTGSLEPDGIVIIKNVRDFTYGDGSVNSMNWIPEVKIPRQDIVRAWFILEPFAAWEAVGHTFLTLELKDGSAYSFSIEARMEKGEQYSALWGLFRKYELAYTWGTERDFVTRRLLYLNHPVKMYPLALNTERAQRLFLALLRKTNEIAEHPRFYNTLTANCTNMLAEIANEVKPGSIPYNISWNLPGFSDRFLMKIKYIEVEESKEKTQKKYDLTEKRKEILLIATSSYSEFGKELRALISSPTQSKKL